MDQEKVSHSLTLKGKVTVEMTLQALYALAKAYHDNQQFKMENRSFVGETNFNEFMATREHKDVEQLLSSEVHLAKLKHYLEEYSVGFSYYEKEGKTYLFFEAKNRPVVEKALKQMISDITKSPEQLEKFTKKVLKKPHEMTPEEKIAYYKSHVVYKGMSPVVTKEIGKDKTR